MVARLAGKALVPLIFLLAMPAARGETAYDLNTPIQTMAADPAAAAVLNKDMPGLLNNENYGTFKALNLKQVRVLAGGRLDRETLSRTAADLRALRTNPAMHSIGYTPHTANSSSR